MGTSNVSTNQTRFGYGILAIDSSIDNYTRTSIEGVTEVTINSVSFDGRKILCIVRVFLVSRMDRGLARNRQISIVTFTILFYKKYPENMMVGGAELGKIPVLSKMESLLCEKQ